MLKGTFTAIFLTHGPSVDSAIIVHSAYFKLRSKLPTCVIFIKHVKLAFIY